MDLIFDACFVVHSTPLTVGDLSLLDFVDRLARAPTYHLTRKVRTEITRHGAGEWVATLESAGRLHVASNEHRQASAYHDQLERRYKGQTPGIHDVGLLRLARSSSAALVTNDHDFYRVAREQHDRVFDILDILLAGVGASQLTLAGLAEALTFLASKQPHFLPLGWKELRLTWPAGCSALTSTRRDPVELFRLLHDDQT